MTQAIVNPYDFTKNENSALTEHQPYVSYMSYICNMIFAFFSLTVSSSFT